MTNFTDKWSDFGKRIARYMDAVESIESTPIPGRTSQTTVVKFRDYGFSLHVLTYVDRCSVIWVQNESWETAVRLLEDSPSFDEFYAFYLS